jgi:hypothetical protein|tara:strand:+ start:19 stop:423 length:405 start_codon:yes stop_codon:yes gene_type:complete
MATTTAAITLTSSDLTSDALSLSKTATLTVAGSGTTGLSETSGIARKKYSGTPADNVVAESDDFDDNRAHKVYLFNTSTSSSEYFIVKVGTTIVGRLYAGDWMFTPWAGASDVTVQPSESTDMTIEFAIIADNA